MPHTPEEPLEHVAQLIHPGTKTAKAGGSRLNIQCIAHEDRTPSLTIWHDVRGKLAFNCHAGCTHDQIVDRLPPAALDYARQTWGVEATIVQFPTTNHKPQPPPEVKPNGEIHYPYATEDGEIAFVVVRAPGKRIYQMHYQKGHLVKGRGDAELIPYRLPDVIAANQAGDTIYIVEGEKDADNLARLGLTATTNPGGAGNWDETLSGWFAGAHVIIIPDNDPSGHQHALDVSLKLDQIAESVKIVQLPDLPDKGDISDWIEAGGTRDQLEQLVAEQRGETQPIAGVQSLNLTEVLTGNYANEQWLVEPILPKGRQISLYAQGKTGKSLLTLEIACALATGRPVLLEPAREPMSVVYVDFEMTPGDLQERLKSLGYETTDPDFAELEKHLHYYMLQPFDPLDTKQGGEQLAAVVQHHQAELVIIDTFIRSVEGEENSSDTVKNFNRYTGQRLKSLTKTLLRVDHAGKDATRGQRGSSAKRDDVDLIWRLRHDSTNNGVDSMRLVNDASRMAWVEHEVQIIRHDEPLRHEIKRRNLNGPECDAWKALEDLNVPADLAQNRAYEMVKEAYGTQHKQKDVKHAQAWRKTSPGLRPKVDPT